MTLNSDISTALSKHNIEYAQNIHELDMHFSLDSLEQLEYSEDRHFWHLNRKQLVKKLIEKNVQPGFRGIDVGCGNGSVVGTMEKEFPGSQWTGVDGYLDGLINARKRTGKARLEWQDITQLENLSDHKYDVALILDVLEHLDHPEKVVDKMRGLLNKKSYVIATVPADMQLWSDRDVFLGHRKRYSKNDLSTLFTNHGYEVIQVNYCFSHLYLPAYLFRKILSKSKGGQQVEEDELKVRPVINPLMTTVGNLEVNLSRKINLPFGTSTWCLAKLKA